MKHEHLIALQRNIIYSFLLLNYFCHVLKYDDQSIKEWLSSFFIFYLFTSGIQAYSWLVGMIDQPDPMNNFHRSTRVNQDNVWPDHKRVQQIRWTDHTIVSGDFFHTRTVHSPGRNRLRVHCEWPSACNRRIIVLGHDWALSFSSKRLEPPYIPKGAIIS